MTYSLSISGPVPSKKNRYRYSQRGGYVPAEIAQQLETLAWELYRQWGNRKPIEYASVFVRFFVPDGKADLDNKYTAVQDLLVKAGVLRNDSISRVRSFACEAVIASSERALIEITEQDKPKRKKAV